jgi:hypothetical protein
MRFMESPFLFEYSDPGGPGQWAGVAAKTTYCGSQMPPLFAEELCT